MEARISVLTLGVADLERAVTFYRDGLGLATEGIFGQEYEYGAVAFFRLQESLQLALWPRESIAQDTGVPIANDVAGAITIGHNKIRQERCLTYRKGSGKGELLSGLKGSKGCNRNVNATNDRSMETVTIRQLGVSDVHVLREISRETFAETFSEVNTKSDMEKYLRENLSLEQLTAELNHKDSRFYLAEVGDQVAGYLKINIADAQTENVHPAALEIERIYVLQKFQGRKVGRLLFEKAMEIARVTDAEFVWLGVWEKNHNALAFYKKQGFTAFGKHVFRLGDDEQTDILMKRDQLL